MSRHPLQTVPILLSVLMTVVLLHAHCVSAGDVSMKLNCSERNWYPFLFMHRGKISGILFDMVDKATRNLNIQTAVMPVPLRRAIVNARRGMVDGVIAVGYHAHLLPDLEYPPEADQDGETPWRLLQVDHVVVSSADDSYEFSGDLKSLPEPVRLLQGAPIIEDLVKNGVHPQEVREDVQNFMKLIRDGDGVIITTSVAAEMMNRDDRFKGKLKIHGMPVASNAYYLVFSKKSAVSRDQRMRLWQEIRRLREDYIFMLQVFSQY